MSPPIEDRAHCATCGWLLRAGRCEACGGDAIPRPVQDADGWEAPPSAVGRGAERAVEAFRGRDWPRMMAHLIGGEGWSSRAIALRDGPGWILSIGAGVAFVAIDSATASVVVEAPVVRLSQRKRVPALRAALELAARDETGCRLALRDDRLVARFEAPLASTPPDAIAAAITRVAELSDAGAASFAARFDASPALRADQRATCGWDALGTPRALALLAPPGVTPRAPLAPSAEEEAAHDSIPPILAPALAAPPSLRGGTPVSGRDTPPASRRETSPYFQATGGATGMTRRATVHGLEVEAPSRRGTMPPPASTAEPPSEADRLCDLLRQAQALATALSFEQKPATMLLLVRATVYRAIHEHAEALPDVVAHLHRATIGLTKEIWSSGAHRISTQIPVAEPALLVMQRIVAANAQVEREPPLVVEPLTSAVDAKQHLSRFVAEIDKAPSDPALRHFLALGALCELLVRTKLPATTTERLRDIVAHAQRGGPKPSTIDLMMTALARIVAR